MFMGLYNQVFLLQDVKMPFGHPWPCKVHNDADMFCARFTILVILKFYLNIKAE